MFDIGELREAQAVVGKHMQPTAQIAWPLLAQRLGAQAWVKHENHNPTGAFKVRGGLTYVDHLVRYSGAVSLVTATRGNHGQSIALAGGLYGVPVTIVVPIGNSVEKNAAMRAYGAELIEHGRDFDASRDEARRLSGERGALMVPSFDRNLVVGVATYALELLTAIPDLDLLYVPIGLGSGIVGCIMVRDLLGLKTRIIGVQSTGAPSYALSFAAGHPVPTNDAVTNADGMATRVPDPVAVEMINKGADRIVTVSDDEVAEAIRIYWSDTHNLAEGGGAAALAAALQERERIQGKKVGLVLSGGNIDAALFQSWLYPG
ncbi:threonine dehydratase [Sphingosinicella rhizophila]|uniref:Threonine dehydratase n=1 Tax=Sphingosinicella rhizophila TaxID=3050082 RepID=A0ABU3QCY5_9SPHN|nr:threonine dehydratase [Sphingosinicella sp. GR2756]MDT9600820.1 threonine dehydratase [Sphingosinicella sp. GR2756]